MKILERGTIEILGEESIKSYIMRTENLTKDDLPIFIRYEHMSIVKSKMKGVTMVLCSKEDGNATLEKLTSLVDSGVIIWPNITCKSPFKRMKTDKRLTAEDLDKIAEEEQQWRKILSSILNPTSKESGLR